MLPRLSSFADENYRKFQEKITPGVAGILGVRMPILRRLAKDLLKTDWQTAFRSESEPYSHELRILQALVIAAAPLSPADRLRWVEWFIPKICSWGVCDSFCCALKPKTTDEFDALIDRCLAAEGEYEVRFGVIMLLSYYLTDSQIDRTLQRLRSVTHQGYYVQMALGWTLCEAYLRYPRQTAPLLPDYPLARRKLRESLRSEKNKKKK